ncbi:hypothetical protein [Halovivax gelatinilyticus]|uniref:hypothetical protein n=1 Tax=Halovivax gelatinilyticus TaxID=2961597 RepID=UPI0020CA5CF9|nr:hypothetical protein [Halovivax gelatinilyticus]
MTAHGFGAIRTNRQAIAWGVLVGTGVFALFGIVTGLIPNPIYVRMVPRTPIDYGLLTATAALAGIYTTLRLATDLPETELEDGDGVTEDRWAVGGLIGGFLAVGCPICNAFLLALFSSSALMTYFDPLRPVLGVVAVATFGGLIYVRHQRTCPTCNA